MRPALFSLLVLFQCVLFTIHFANAGSISLVGLQDTSNIKATGFDVGKRTGAGGGLLLTGTLFSDVSLETGALTFTHTWADDTSGNNILSGYTVQIPLVFELKFWRHFYIGVGGYYSTNSGTLSKTGTNPDNDLDYSTYGIKNSETGYVGNLGFHVPLFGATFLRAEGRYTQGGANIATDPANSFVNRDFQFLVGLTFAFGTGGGSAWDNGSSSRNSRR